LRTAQLATSSIMLLGVAACGTSATTSSSTGASSSAAAPAAVLADLAPSGRLRVAIPANPPVLGVKDPASGNFHGIGVDIVNALAQQLGVPVDLVSYPDPNAEIAAAAAGMWDVSIVPVNDKATAAADLTAPFLLIPHTYLVRADSSIHSVADADQTGVRIASVASAGHTAVLAGKLKHAQLVRVDTDAAGVQMLASGQVDAFADARSPLRGLAAQVPGSRLVSDDFFVANFALAVPKGHATGQAFLARFIESEKASGAVQQAIDRLGKPDLTVAPAASG
jgi:polar amino acid transport system substrate-binding protein